MSKYLLGLDVESTGFSPTKDVVIEIGAVLMEVDTWQPVKILSEIVHTDKEVSEFITELTGITNAHVQTFGADKGETFLALDDMAKHAVACVAHNASFDRNMLKGNGWETELPWVCTVNDIPYPPKYKSKELFYVAAKVGYVNPFPHRAVFDVLAMFKAIESYDLASILDKLTLPIRTLKALVSYDEKELAKKVGFRWDKEDRVWTKVGRFTEDEIRGLPFEVEEFV